MTSSSGIRVNQIFVRPFEPIPYKPNPLHCRIVQVIKRCFVAIRNWVNRLSNVLIWAYNGKVSRRDLKRVCYSLQSADPQFREQLITSLRLNVSDIFKQCCKDYTDFEELLTWLIKTIPNDLKPTVTSIPNYAEIVKRFATNETIILFITENLKSYQILLLALRLKKQIVIEKFQTATIQEIYGILSILCPQDSSDEILTTVMENIDEEKKSKLKQMATESKNCFLMTKII